MQASVSGRGAPCERAAAATTATSTTVARFAVTVVRAVVLAMVALAAGFARAGFALAVRAGFRAAAGLLLTFLLTGPPVRSSAPQVIRHDGARVKRSDAEYDPARDVGPAALLA